MRGRGAPAVGLVVLALGCGDAEPPAGTVWREPATGDVGEWNLDDRGPRPGLRLVRETKG